MLAIFAGKPDSKPARHTSSRIGFALRLTLGCLAVGLLGHAGTGCLHEEDTPEVCRPVLALSPRQLDFGLGRDTLQTVLHNTGRAPLDWTVSIESAWLQAEPSSGIILAGTQPITWTIDRDALTPGRHQTTAGVHSNGGAESLAISVQVALPGQWSYVILDSFPHDPTAFTQGLAVRGDTLYEGTGRYGHSTLRAVALESGEVLRQRDLNSRYFGEGIALVDTTVIQLTLNAHRAFVCDLDDFHVIERFDYETVGWGLTFDGERLILSNGSSFLYFLDPLTHDALGNVEVLDAAEPVDDLNELEFINGEIFANVYRSEQIVRIDPISGQVTGWIDLAGLRDRLDTGAHVDVLNGIAYDPARDRLFVTGKLWPLIYEIEIVPVVPGAGFAVNPGSGAPRP